MGDAVEEAGDPDDLVVVTDPYTDKRTTYYRHDPTDVYRQRQVISAPKVPMGTVQAQLNRLLAEATYLLEGQAKLLARTHQGGRFALDAKSQEEILLAQVSKQHVVTEAIAQADSQLTDEQRTLAHAMRKRLDAASQALTLEGVRLRIAAARRLPPTVGNLDYLLDKREVKIGNWSWTDKTSSRKGPDFLLEFEVLDEKNFRQGRQKVLWYAHFHCSRENVKTLRKGHLKLAALRYKTYDDQLREAQNREVAIIASSDIRERDAQRLFFSRMPA